MIASPIGAWVIRNRPQFVGRVIRGPAPTRRGRTRTSPRSPRRCRSRRAPRASQQLYRTFLLKEFGPAAAGRYHKSRLTVPTKLLFGTDDFAIPKSFFTRPTEEFADDFTIEFIPDTGHFIAEERPELVNDRALEFFGRD